MQRSNEFGMDCLEQLVIHCTGKEIGQFPLAFSRFSDVSYQLTQDLPIQDALSVKVRFLDGLCKHYGYQLHAVALGDLDRMLVKNKKLIVFFPLSHCPWSKYYHSIDTFQYFLLERKVAGGYQCSRTDDECRERLLPYADFAQGILLEKAELYYLHNSGAGLSPSEEAGLEVRDAFEAYLKIDIGRILQNMMERLLVADSLKTCLAGFSPADANNSFIVNLFHLQRSYTLFCHFLLNSEHTSKEVKPIVYAMKNIEGCLKRVNRKLAKAGLYITLEEPERFLKLCAQGIVELLHQSITMARELDILIEHWLA